MCPECGSHDVAQLTRITGYINDVAGFNNGKAQEVKDRVRSNIVQGEYKRINGMDD
jgi:anaerobic ribonucleoside-triphosphate reductase